MLQRVIAYLKANKVLAITWGVLLVVGLWSLGSLLLPKIHFKFPFPIHKTIKTQVTAVDPNEVIRQKNAEIIASAAKQIALPSGEEPVLATVSDRDKLQNQDFFKQAQNGDKILLFPKHKKVFLYRPSLDRVIAQAPLIYQDGSTDASATAQTTDLVPKSNGPIPTIKPNGKVLYNNQ